VSFATEGSYAFRPRQIVCKGTEAAGAAAELIAKATDTDPLKPLEIFGEYLLVTAPEKVDVENLVAQLREAGLSCEPNYVLFSHGDGSPTTPNDCWCGCCPAGGGAAANPFFANSIEANPFFANSVQANPFFANPFFANPFFANPFFANPFFANPFFANSKESGVQPSSAIPVPDFEGPTTPQIPENRSRVIILDTGIAGPADLPVMLNDARYDGPDAGDIDPADENDDKFLDPASGHGTFVAGIVEQLAPKQDVYVLSVLNSYGDGDVATIAARINQLLLAGLVDKNTIINMSFGSYADEDMELLIDVIAAVRKRDAVVVASAGNDGTCRPSYPACLDDVIAVGSIEPKGRALYSNHGPWVQACAPGSGLISAFFKLFEGNLVAGPGAPDPDNFAEWAMWTGTSFAAPIVTAAIARHMALMRTDADTAAIRVVHSPGLARSPGVGTVVNLVPGM